MVSERWITTARVSMVGGACLLALVGVLLTLVDADGKPTAKPPEQQEQPPAYRVESLRGKVVWLADSLQQQLGIKTVPEAHQRILALETAEKQVIPLVEDLRGRSFRTDPRLRELHVELLVRRYRRMPLAQVVRIYELADDGKYIIDYWCDVCAIVMFESGSCSCCQDQNRLRRRRVDQQENPIE